MRTELINCLPPPLFEIFAFAAYSASKQWQIQRGGAVGRPSPLASEFVFSKPFSPHFQNFWIGHCAEVAGVPLRRDSGIRQECHCVCSSRRMIKASRLSAEAEWVVRDATSRQPCTRHWTLESSKASDITHTHTHTPTQTAQSRSPELNSPLTAWAYPCSNKICGVYPSVLVSRSGLSRLALASYQLGSLVRRPGGPLRQMLRQRAAYNTCIAPQVTYRDFRGAGTAEANVQPIGCRTGPQTRASLTAKQPQAQSQPAVSLSPPS